MSPHGLWNSIDRLSSLVTLANWGIAISLLLGFTFTVIAIKASGRKDELVSVEELKKSGQIADTMKLAGDANERAAKLEAGNIALKTELERATAESRSKQTELEVEQRKTAEAQEKAARAQKELAGNLSSFALRSGDRVLDFQKFADGIKDVSKLSVEIWYAPNDEETDSFSYDIQRALNIANWRVSRRTLTPEDSLAGIRVATIKGMLFFFGDERDMHSTTFDGFMWAILKAIRFGAVSQAATTAPEVPKGAVVLIIGPRVKV